MMHHESSRLTWSTQICNLSWSTSKMKSVQRFLEHEDWRSNAGLIQERDKALITTIFRKESNKDFEWIWVYSSKPKLKSGLSVASRLNYRTRLVTEYTVKNKRLRARSPGDHFLNREKFCIWHSRPKFTEKHKTIETETQWAPVLTAGPAGRCVAWNLSRKSRKLPANSKTTSGWL